MGDAERAQDVELFQRQNAIDNARRSPHDLAGPIDCIKCGHPNDRSPAGFAVCSSCMEEAGGG